MQSWQVVRTSRRRFRPARRSIVTAARTPIAKIAKETDAGSNPASGTSAAFEADAPRPRTTSATELSVTAPLPAASLRSFAVQPHEPSWPRTRAEVDVALHSIGLALDELLDGAQIDEAHGDTDAIPRVYDVRAELRERFANAAVDARRVDVIIDGERVILVGVVNDDLTRLLAEDIAWSLPEVAECENRLAVECERRLAVA